MHRDLNEQLIELLPRMRRFATGLAGAVDRGDELVQIACERLLKHHSRLKPDTRLDSWLYQVIRNLHVDSIRAQKARDRSVESVREITEIQGMGVSVLDQQLALHEVHLAMQELSEEHRSVLMLICVEGLSYKEAADVLEVPMGTVTSRIVRGRKALMDLLADDVEKVPLGAAE